VSPQFVGEVLNWWANVQHRLPLGGGTSRTPSSHPQTPTPFPSSLCVPPGKSKNNRRRTMHRPRGDVRFRHSFPTSINQHTFFGLFKWQTDHSPPCIEGWMLNLTKRRLLVIVVLAGLVIWLVASALVRISSISSIGPREGTSPRSACLARDDPAARPAAELICHPPGRCGHPVFYPT
jgi:hypothetical protein